MSQEKQYSEEVLFDVNPVKHIRIRPGMYLGRVDEKGNLEIMKALFQYLDEYAPWNTASFVYVSDTAFKITFNNTLNFKLTDMFFTAMRFAVTTEDYMLQLIVGLSEKCTIRSKDVELYYEKGELISEKQIAKVDELSIIFTFDTTILHSSKLPKYLLFNFFKRYTFLYPEKEIHVFENEQSIANFSSNGLQSWFETYSFDAELLMKPFQVFIEDTSLDLKAEMMFSIHSGKESFSTITLPRVDFIRKNGTHAIGFLKGLKNAIQEIVGEDIRKPIFSEYINPIGVFKLSYPDIVFHGPTRNEVGSEELVEIFENITQKKLLANEDFANAILTLFNIK